MKACVCVDAPALTLSYYMRKGNIIWVLRWCIDEEAYKHECTFGSQNQHKAKEKRKKKQPLEWGLATYSAVDKG